MTVKQAAARLGVGIGMIYKLLRLGRLGYIQVGSRKVVLDESVADYLASNTHQPTSRDPEQPKVIKRKKGKPIYRYLDL